MRTKWEIRFDVTSSRSHLLINTLFWTEYWENNHFWLVGTGFRKILFHSEDLTILISNDSVKMLKLLNKLIIWRIFVSQWILQFENLRDLCSFKVAETQRQAFRKAFQRITVFWITKISIDEKKGDRKKIEIPSKQVFKFHHQNPFWILQNEGYQVYKYLLFLSFNTSCALCTFIPSTSFTNSTVRCSMCQVHMRSSHPFNGIMVPHKYRKSRSF